MRMPTWLRVLLVAGAVVVVAGAGVFAYRWYVRPTTLTIAVGSLDGEASRLVSAVAGKLVQSNAPVRLRMVETSSALDAANSFASGKVDLAVVRGDVGDLSQAQAVVIVAHAVALLVAPQGSAIADMGDLKRISVGVIGGEMNRKLISVLTDKYDLARAGVTFRSLSSGEVRGAIESREVRAVLFVVPLVEKYLSLIRNLFLQSAKATPVLIAIESAGAIAEKERAYESFEVPKGTLRGSPPVPGDDLTTLKTSFYLVAQKALGSELVGRLTESVMNARRDLLADMPIIAQIAAPDTDADAYLPVHPGAAAFYNASQQSFLDKWGNIIFLAPMIVGGVASICAAAWKFLRTGEPQTRQEALDMLYALGRRIRSTDRDDELAEIEQEIDRVLQAQRLSGSGGNDAREWDVTALNVAAHRLQNLVHDRRIALALKQGGNAFT